jgi:hypothetical protein
MVGKFDSALALLVWLMQVDEQSSSNPTLGF